MKDRIYLVILRHPTPFTLTMCSLRLGQIAKVPCPGTRLLTSPVNSSLLPPELHSNLNWLAAFILTLSPNSPLSPPVQLIVGEHLQQEQRGDFISGAAVLPPGGPAVPRLPVGRLQVCVRVPRLSERSEPWVGRHQVRFFFILFLTFFLFFL